LGSIRLRIIHFEVSKMTTQFQSNVSVFRQPQSFNGFANVYEINSCNMEIREKHVITFPECFDGELADRHIKAANISLAKQNKKGTGYFIDAADLGASNHKRSQYVLFCDNEFYAEYLENSPLCVRAERFSFRSDVTDDAVKDFISVLTNEVRSYCKSFGYKDAIGMIGRATGFDLDSGSEKTYVLICNDSFYQGYQAQLMEEAQPLPVG
jgi:hypothetical protein